MADINKLNVPINVAVLLERLTAENANLKEENAKLKTESNISIATLIQQGVLDETTASEHKEIILAWQPNQNVKIGDYRTDNDKLYKCLQAHTTLEGWEPENVPALWKQVNGNEWSQPICKEDTYMLGDEAIRNGEWYVSDIDYNAYDPLITGWHKK